MKGIVRALVAFVVLFVFFNVMDEVGKSGSDDNEPSDTIKSNWHHDVGVDPMGEYHYEIAKISNGGVSVQVQRKKGYFSVFVISGSGNISCGDGCTPRVKFDEEKPVKVLAYSIKENVIALSDMGLSDDYRPLWEKIKKSQKLSIELNVIDYGIIAQSGSITFAFDTEGNPFSGELSMDIKEVMKKVSEPSFEFNELSMRGKILGERKDIGFDDCKSFYNKSIQHFENQGHQVVSKVIISTNNYFQAVVYISSGGLGISCDSKRGGEYYELNYL